MTSVPKQRLLCLHGYTQSAIVFKNRTAILRKDLSSLADLVYADGPYIVPSETEAADGKDIQRSWWSEDEGFQPSLAYLKTIWKEQGPFTGILGFSQGATTAAILASEIILSDPAEELTHPKYIIVVSGFLPTKAGDEAVERWFPKVVSSEIVSPYNITSLHVIGARDNWVVPERSRLLMERYGEKAMLLEHDGGHLVPTNAEMRKQFKAFIGSFSI
ncbi:hypothetical protein HDU97_009314 [Phlyctochytrium planicorne]|nr:hypothetical protein HDU97_009314 [Phlyctochytrium planicorne]